MADTDTSKEDRQLAASGKKIHKARMQGNLPRSRDVGHALVLGAGLAAFVALGPGVGEATLEIVRHGLRFGRPEALEPGRMGAWLGGLAGAAMWIVAPAGALFAAAAAAASMIPGGAVLTLEPLTPNFSKLNPANGLGRILSKDSAVDLLRLALIAFALAGIAFWFAAGRLGHFAGLTTTPLPAALQATHGAIAAGIGLLVALLVAAALVDVPLQWWRYHENLKMTHQEAREEHRESEGNPEIRGRVRSRQREIARSRMLAAVPAADVVVTNPTHYAVAIRYEDGKFSAPRVVAKGADHLAAKIREIAMDAGVPLFEAPPLARALYAHVEVDREIPSSLYTAVAQVLAYVYQLRRHVPGRGSYPRAPQDLEIPAGMDPQEKAE